MGKDQFTGYSSASEKIEFVGGLSREYLWFSRSGNDLNVNLLGYSDSILIAGWYAGRPIKEFVAGDMHLSASAVDQLVNAMAAFQPNTGADAFGVRVDRLDETVLLAIDTSWK